MPKPDKCEFCQQNPSTKEYKFTSPKTGKQVTIWVCDTCYTKTQTK